MNIYVCVKQTPDTETKVKLNADASGIDSNGIKWIVSPYDEYALEEALLLKQKFAGSTVTVLSAGPERVKEAIRTGLAMGADQGLHIDLPENADPYLTAKALAEALKKEPKIDLILTGKEAIDDGGSQVSQLLASLLGVPCVTVVVKTEYTDQKVKCHREVEGGAQEIIEVSYPALLATQKGLNEPRYASLPNIMKAKKKEIKTLPFKDLGVSEATQKLRFKNFKLPPAKQAGKKLTGEPAQQVKELVRLLHEEAKVV